MKALIIVFSQTGNTRNVADRIYEGIRDSGAGCDMVSLPEAKDLDRYDLVGIGCPVFYYKEPFHVRTFLQELPAQQDKPWFVFCTHGSVMGITLESMARELANKGARVIGSHHTYADAWVPFYPHPTLTTGHPDQQELEEARAFGREIASIGEAVRQGDLSGIRPIPEVTVAWAREEADLLSRDFLGQVMPRLEIDPEACTQCQECQELCPAGGIDVLDSPPKIQDPCIYCWHCVNVCPECAVKADWNPLLQMAPANYERYAEALKGAEARGEFRWLVDPDSMDFANPFQKQREEGKKSIPERPQEVVSSKKQG